MTFGFLLYTLAAKVALYEDVDVTYQQTNKHSSLRLAVRPGGVIPKEAGAPLIPYTDSKKAVLPVTQNIFHVNI